MSVNLPWFSKNAAALGAVALSVGVLAACSSNSSSGASTSGASTSSSASTNGSAATGAAAANTSPITIGASLSLTGDFSQDGQAYDQGYKLWAKDVNAAGGIMGRQVKLTILNDASSPNQVVTNYNTLISTDHVDLTFGPFSSLLTTPASAVAAHNGYALVEGAGGAPTVFQSPANEADHDVFDVSLPVADEMLPFVNYMKTYIASLPAAQQKNVTAAFPMAQDPFADPPVQLAEEKLKALGVRSVYDSIFPEESSDNYTGPANQVAADKPDIVVLGSTDAGTVASFVKVFEQQHYTPKLFIAAAGPDEGSTFIGDVGAGNATGMMVPDGWYPLYNNASSRKMVAEYVKEYGGTPAGVNADIAEAYSVGQVMAQAIVATKGTDNAAIIKYLHSGVKLTSVQGPVQFDDLGENGSSDAFTFQWQDNGKKFLQVLPASAAGSVKIISTKPAWTSGS